MYGFIFDTLCAGVSPSLCVSSLKSLSVLNTSGGAQWRKVWKAAMAQSTGVQKGAESLDKRADAQDSQSLRERRSQGQGQPCSGGIAEGLHSTEWPRIEPEAHIKTKP